MHAGQRIHLRPALNYKYQCDEPLNENNSDQRTNFARECRSARADSGLPCLVFPMSWR